MNDLKNIIQTYPKENLSCNINGTHYKWYTNDGKTRTYLEKKYRPFAEQLAQKQYFLCQLEDLQKEQLAINAYLEAHNTGPSETEKLLTEEPEFQKLLTPYFQSLSAQQLDWMNSPYERNPAYPEKLIIQSSSGNLVRSKSEALIDMILFTKKISFRYECLLNLGESIVYPDFTILHPRTGKIYYWEHFGLMDKAKYAQRASNKLQLYISHGIIPSIQLIVTYETSDHPLTPDMIEKIVTHYFE